MTDIEKIKITPKFVVSKFCMFLFSMLFISTFIAIFGKENSIIGVTMLMGFFISFSADMKYENKQSSLVLFAMFAVVVFMPKLSLINPFFGIAVNLISISLIMILCGFNEEGDNQLTFMMGYVFAQGNDVVGNIYIERVAGVLVCGAIFSLIYFFTHKKSTCQNTVKDAFKGLSIYSPHTQWFIKVAVTLTIVMFLGDLLNFPRAMWINLAVVSIMQRSSDVNRQRRKHRLTATIVGTICFWIIFVLIIPPQYSSIAVIIGGFIAMFPQTYGGKTLMNTINALAAAMVLFSVGEALYIRIIANVFGIAAVIIADLVFNKYLPIKDNAVNEI